ncbi:hypothetical protein [Leptolyngbya sp. CCY15150]|uniref:hypothetical protein n=1 Tax=Leptolyngbya sp. CCY15150 TaxID=2767772 RepID=UPI0019501B50|nr:hypothetical protein [Leptolyngbya sp. CCY15150]
MKMGDVALPKNDERIIDSAQGHYRIDLGAIVIESFFVTLTFNSSIVLRGAKPFSAPFAIRPTITATLERVTSSVTIFDVGTFDTALSNTSSVDIRLGAIRNGSRTFVAGDTAIVHVTAIGESS